MRGANFSAARMQGVDLMDASLRGANLNQADLAGADALRADFAGALLTSTKFGQVKNLRQGQLDLAIGNSDTAFPPGAARLHVWTCWTDAPETLAETLLTMPPRDRALWRDRWLCGDRPRREVGHTAPE